MANLIASTRTVFTVTSLDLGSMYLYIYIYCNGIPALYFEWAYVSRRGRPDVACVYYAMHARSHTPNIAAAERHDLCVHIFEHRRSI